MKPLHLLFVLLSVAPMCINTAAAELKVRYQVGGSEHDRRYAYFLEVLNMALEATRYDHGDYRLIRSDAGISQQRAFELLSEGQGLDIFWGMSSIRRELLAHPIPFPLLRGLLGVRVPLAHPESARKLANIDSILGLSRLTSVQGDGWPDTRILRHNGLPVITSSDYNSLFEMLRQRRVDYFPRSVAEVWDELDSPLGEGLMVQPELLLVYQGPIYFFVHKDNHELADRLQTGLERIWSNGQFNNLFFSRPELSKALDLINYGQYRVLHLSSPWRLPSLDSIPEEYWIPLPGQQHQQRQQMNDR